MFNQIIIDKVFVRKGQYNYVVICNHCKTVFKIRESLIKRGKGCFCSTKCAGEARKGIHVSPSTEIKPGQRISIKTEFKPGNKSWSEGKILWHLRGESSCHWTGGSVVSLGYKLIRTTSLINNVYEREHRLIVEKELGRKLSRSEIIHHINGNKSDNRIENLYLFNNQSEHQTYHLLIKNNKVKEIKDSNIKIKR